MIYKGYQLQAYFNCLQLAGMEDGELQWIGKREQWNKLDKEEERILREHYEGVKWSEH